MPDREKVIKGLECCTCDLPLDNKVHFSDLCELCPYYNKRTDYCFRKVELMRDALALLQEQEAVVKQWTKEIADNQLAHAPNDSPMSLDEQLECEYKRGIWDGLQIAWNIISEGR